MRWDVQIHKKVAKQIKKLPANVQAATFLLLRDLEFNGPKSSAGWKHYGKLKAMRGDKRHCHVTRDKTTYICCWEVIDKKIRLLEVYYVGTHENAPY